MEFLLLLISTFLLSLLISFVVVQLFRKPIDKIFIRIIGDEIAVAWRKFLIFAIFVVGVSSGVSTYHFEKFIEASKSTSTPTPLTVEYWGLELYRTFINTLGGMAWALLVFFIIALIAFVIVKASEGKGKSA